MSLKIYRRGKIWHYRGSVAGRQLRGTTGATDKGIAQRVAAEAESKAWDRRFDEPGEQVTFAQAALAYRGAEKSDRHLVKVEDHWKDTPIRDITPGAIKAACFKLYPDAKAATRNRQVIVPTQAIINFAAELSWCSPIKVKRFPVDAKTKTPATAAWVAAFAATASPHLGALCLFMFRTAARISEAVALTWTNVDLDARTAILSGRKPRPWTRTVHLPQPVLAAMANIPSNRSEHEPVFGYAGAGSVKQPWDAVIIRAGINRMTPHCCRHGFATTLLRAGQDVKTVAKLGGWKDAATVLRTYAHAIEDRTLTESVFGTKEAQPMQTKTITNGKKRKKSTLPKPFVGEGCPKAGFSGASGVAQARNWR